MRAHCWPILCFRPWDTEPAQAIRRLLADAGLRPRDVTHVALARDPQANRAAKLAYVARHPLNSAGAVVEHLGHAR